MKQNTHFTDENQRTLYSPRSAPVENSVVVGYVLVIMQRRRSGATLVVNKAVACIVLGLLVSMHLVLCSRRLSACSGECAQSMLLLLSSFTWKSGQFFFEPCTLQSFSAESGFCASGFFLEPSSTHSCRNKSAESAGCSSARVHAHSSSSELSAHQMPARDDLWVLINTDDDRTYNWNRQERTSDWEMPPGLRPGWVRMEYGLLVHIDTGNELASIAGMH